MAPSLDQSLNQSKLLKNLGYEIWHLREQPTEPKKSFQTSEYEQSLKANQTDGLKITDSQQKVVATKKTLEKLAEQTKRSGAKSFDELTQIIQNCTLCPLSQSRKQVVVGSGNQKADLMIVGEAPGANEDESGLPFVGRSGKLLDSILFAIGLKREQIYIANIIKCRPPNNRNPEIEEMNHCQHYLYEQIGFIQPKLIVTLGAISSQYLLKSVEPMGRLRQKLHSFELKSGQQSEKNQTQSYPLIASYHPAYLLRDPMQKAKAWQDWKMIKKIIEKNNL